MRAGDTRTLVLFAGQVLTVTNSSDALGSVTRLSDSVGEASFAPVAIAGVNLSFGPYGTDRRFAIACTSGDVTHSQAAFEPSTGDPAGVATAIAAAIALLKSAGIAFSAAAAGITLKSGANGRTGTFTANGVTQVDVANTNVAATDIILIALKTPDGTVGVSLPALISQTAGVGFSVVALALDTSIYSYVIIKVA